MNDKEAGTGSEVETVDGGVVVARLDGLLVLQGPKSVVEQLITNEPVLRDRQPSETTRTSDLGSLDSLLGLIPGRGTHQQVFKLDATALKQFNAGQVTQSADGLSMVARGADGKFLAQGKLLPIDINPADALNAQMALMTLALSAAINEVADAVARVEDKVDRLTAILDADRVGAIVGAHRALSRRAELAGPDGSLADADWHAIDDVGIQVEQQIESLRSFVRKRLVNAESKGSGITDRRDALDDVGDLSETLELLVVAQDSLFLFQQLRLARIRGHEPARLSAAINEARTLISGHEVEDADLLVRVRRVVAELATVQALEIHRFITTGSLVENAAQVDQMLAWFGGQRSMPYEPMAEVEVPGIDDAVLELRTRGKAIASDGQRIADGLKERFRSRGKDQQHLTAGNDMLALPEASEDSDDATTTDPVSESAPDRLRSRLGSAGRAGIGGLRRLADRRTADDDETEQPSDA